MSLTRPLSMSQAIWSMASSTVYSGLNPSSVRGAVKGDPIVAGVLKGHIDLMDLANAHAFHNTLGNCCDGVVLGSKVEDPRTVSFDLRHDRGGHVSDMENRSVLCAAEDLKLSYELCPHNQKIDDQVHPYPGVGVANPGNGGQPEDETVRPLRHDDSLCLELSLGIDRQGIGCAVFVHFLVVCSVYGARRRKQDPAFERPAEPINCVNIDLLRHARIERAGGVTDQGGQPDDSVSPFELGTQLLMVQHVSRR